MANINTTRTSNTMRYHAARIAFDQKTTHFLSQLSNGLAQLISQPSQRMHQLGEQKFNQVIFNFTNYPNG
jgi:hypothetical protein